MTSIDAIGDDLLRNILSRLPALHFASAACVSRSWHRVCDSILSTPKLASALSLNPSIQDAVEEVCSKVFAEPIRPHFAIVAIGSSFQLRVALPLITKKLGSAIPIICTVPFGLMGRDVANGSFKEIPQWGLEEEDDFFHNGYMYDPSVYADPEFFDRPKIPRNPAVLLTVGFLPGMKVAAVTMSQSKKDAPFVDEFVTSIRECSSIASGVTSPVAIMLFTGLGTFMDPVLEKLDCSMSPETAIVGDGSSVFVCGGNCVHSKSPKYTVAGVALLFMRDRDKRHGIGNIQFHVAFSAGLSPIGPTYKVASVREIRGKGTTWLTARKEAHIEELDGQSILGQIYDEMPDHTKYPSLCLGVVKRRKCFLGSSEMKWITSQVFHEVHGGDEAQLFVAGCGIKTGDPFRVFQSDSDMALSSLEGVYDKFRSLKQRSSGAGSSSSLTPTLGNNNIIFGGIIFACIGREDRFFGKYDVDSTPFLENFPGVPLAGLYCGNYELCRGDSSSYDQEAGSYRSFAHSYSSVYFVMSYTPSGPGI